MPALVIFLHLNMPDRWWDVIKTSPAYLIYAATYFHTLVIFAFCNTDDVTWGTKGVNDDVANSFFSSKMGFVSGWLFTNGLVCYLLMVLNSFNNSATYIVVVIFAYASVYIFLRTFFAILYHVLYFTSYKK